ncbi:MAG: dNTP triphosphohydrolase [Halobacteriota archaeon]
MSSANARNIPKGKYVGFPSSEAQNKSKDSKHKECLEGRIFPGKTSDSTRSEWLRDRDRIIYSRFFRRLSSKTQVVAASGRITSDHIRNRLTHSLEVMQIASSIALKVNENSNTNNKIDLDLIQAIALGHDIGHTAYGHVGEKSLYDFLFPNSSNNQEQNEKHSKFHHSFQSLKVCCFLEKSYKPDLSGVNLTIATLDGIFKHTHLNDDERKFYRNIFDSYREAFWEKDEKEIDRGVYEKLTEYLFEYASPVTCEGIIVSIADEFAQLCHDIEDIRRLGGFEAVRGFYDVVKTEINKNKHNLKIAKEPYKEFKKSLKNVLQDNSNSNIVKLERYYIKLMIRLSMSIVSNVIINLRGREDWMSLLKENYFGEFEKLEKSGPELGLDPRDIDLIKSLDEINNEYKKNTLMGIPEVAKWDIKGNELCVDLANILYKSLNHKNNNANGINMNIFNHEHREDLKKSYKAGEKFADKNDYCSDSDNIPVKFTVLDYLVGMTDSSMIKEYGSLTFKRVEL